RRPVTPEVAGSSPVARDSPALAAQAARTSDDGSSSYRISSDHHLPRSRRCYLLRHDGGFLSDRSPESELRETVAFRVRLCTLRRCPRAVRRSFLSCRHPLHHLRPRGGVPVSLGGGPG